MSHEYFDPLGRSAVNWFNNVLRKRCRQKSMAKTNKAIQDLYPDEFAHCFGCGRNNPNGHQLKSFTEDDEVVARFTPPAHQIAVPGFVYGGLLASLADCHAMATAAAASEAAAGRRLDAG